jgi:glutaconate CoA-transferase subunit A
LDYHPGMGERIVSLADAVAVVKDNQTLGLGGMTIYRRPVAFARALIRQAEPPRNLTLLGFTAGLESDMLVGAGLVRQVRACYFGLESFGLAPMFTSAASAGLLTIIEESEASIANGLRARMAGVGFMPSRAWQGTDMLAVRPDVQCVIDPYSGETLTAFPAIGCDVAVIHVLKADRQGNCRLGGNPTIDLELASIARQVIITAEEVVDELKAPVDIPGLAVSMVVHLPGGAWPTSCYPRYPIDGEAILAYIAACNNDEFWTFVAQGSDRP